MITAIKIINIPITSHGYVGGAVRNLTLTLTADHKCTIQVCEVCSPFGPEVLRA